MLPNATNLLTGLAALAAVLALVYGAGRLAKMSGWARRVGGAPGRRLRIEETLALDGRRRLQLVTCDGRAVLLMTGGANDQVLAWPPESSPAGEPRA